jgi:hypothetical protein
MPETSREFTHQLLNLFELLLKSSRPSEDRTSVHLSPLLFPLKKRQPNLPVPAL